MYYNNLRQKSVHTDYPMHKHGLAVTRLPENILSSNPFAVGKSTAYRRVGLRRLDLRYNQIDENNLTKGKNSYA